MLAQLVQRAGDSQPIRTNAHVIRTEVALWGGKRVVVRAWTHTSVQADGTEEVDDLLEHAELGAFLSLGYIGAPGRSRGFEAARDRVGGRAATGCCIGECHLAVQAVLDGLGHGVGERRLGDELIDDRHHAHEVDDRKRIGLVEVRLESAHETDSQLRQQASKRASQATNYPRSMDP